eukprot:scaffold138722_cov37-Tisochrysis_lutea.AAC.1
MQRGPQPTERLGPKDIGTLIQQHKNVRCSLNVVPRETAQRVVWLRTRRLNLGGRRVWLRTRLPLPPALLTHGSALGRCGSRDVRAAGGGRGTRGSSKYSYCSRSKVQATAPHLAQFSI